MSSHFTSMPVFNRKIYDVRQTFDGGQCSLHGHLIPKDTSRSLIHPSSKFNNPGFNSWAIEVQKPVGVGVLECWILKKQRRKPSRSNKASWHWPK